MNEEKEQHSPISILDCPFEDDAITPPSHHKGNYYVFFFNVDRFYLLKANAYI